jgi:uncharacterized protein (TIGR00251 family)
MKKITVEVKPNSKEVVVEKISDLVYKVRLSATPVDGQANDQLIKVLSKYFNISKSQVEIKSGKTSRTKVIILYIS